MSALDDQSCAVWLARFATQGTIPNGIPSDILNRIRRQRLAETTGGQCWRITPAGLEFLNRGQTT